MQLSVITDEIAARLEPALDGCEELGIGAVEPRTVGAGRTPPRSRCRARPRR